VAAILWLQAQPPAVADAVLRLEPQGRLLCSGRPGGRAVRAALSDGSGGHLLVTSDDFGAEAFPQIEGWDVGLIHLGADLDPLVLGDGVGASDPCGALVLGGRGTQRAVAALPWVPGTLLIAALDQDQGGSRVILQGIDTDGRRLLGPQPLLLSDPAFEALSPVLALDGRGGFLCAWTERLPGPDASDRLLLQRFDGRGRPLWEAPTLIARGPYLFSSFATLVPDDEGGAFVSWAEARPTEETQGDYHPRLLRIEGGGLPAWEGGALRLLAEGYVDLDPSLVADGFGGAIALFTAGGARAQRFSSTGARLWGEAGLLLSDAALAARASRPALSPDSEGGLFATWIEEEDSGGGRILVRRFGIDGALPWPAPVAGSSGSRPIARRVQGALPDGTLAIAWEEAPPAGASTAQELRVQAVDRRGRAKAPPNGALPALGEGVRSDPVLLAADPPQAAGPGGIGGLPEATLAWSDARAASLLGPSASLYLQRVGFRSAPRLDPAPIPFLKEGSSAAWSLHGDDLQPGLSVDLGPGIAVREATVRADSPGGPGDSLLLSLEVEGTAPPGRRDLRLLNPDGGGATFAAFTEVRLDPRRIDLDGSGRVDGYDLAVLARSFGRVRGEARYAPAADIDLSGQVDGADLALLASHFGAQAGGIALAASSPFAR